MPACDVASSTRGIQACRAAQIGSKVAECALEWVDTSLQLSSRRPTREEICTWYFATATNGGNPTTTTVPIRGGGAQTPIAESSGAGGMGF